MESLVTYSIIIPVFNTAHSLLELTERIENVFKEEIKRSYEIIFVDDGSTNIETWRILEQLGSREGVKAIQLMRNFGKQGAMMCALEEAKGSYIITMDDDLQHRPEDIPLLITKQSHDVVTGYFSEKEHSIFKRLLSLLNDWFESKLIGKPKHVKNSPFKLMNADVVRAILKIRTSNPSLSGLLFFVTRDVVMVHVTHGKRTEGRSGFTVSKMYRTFSNLIFNNSSFLLRLTAVTGMIISLISFAMAAYFILKKLTVGIPVPGWVSLMTVTLLLGGLILCSVGIVGEYLIRIINGVENKPSFIIRKKTY